MNSTLTTGPANPSRRKEAAAPECIHDVVARQVDRTPDAVAVTYGAASLTYGELDERANQLARVLQRLGVGPDTFVAICIERSLEMTIALLAVLKAGGAYLPLDPAYPASRLAHMIAHTSPVVLLLQERFEALAFDTNIPRVVIDASPEIWTNECAERPDCAATPRNLAYAMYTSGSTGVPRAVLIEHHGVVNHNLAMVEYFELRAGDRVSQCGSLAFDIAVEEIFPTWMAGATVVLHPPGVVGPGREFCQWLVQEQISVVDLPTALWHEWVSYLAQYDDALPAALRLVIVGGQKASAQVLQTWKARTGPHIRWVNGYGPTEASIAMIFYSPDDDGELPLAPDADVPIGRAIAGTMAYILRANDEPCEAGESGEICIGGVGLARGYLHDAEGTAQKFVADPFSTAPGARMYRTGDLARVNAAGLIEFGGRTDDQVKVRGFRVELGDVENAFRQHPDVHDVVVIARETKGYDKQLAAYVVLKHGSDTRVAELLRSLKAKLPAHMVPANTMLMDALPVTPTGKTDKKALPDIGASRDVVSAEYVAPETQEQRTLAAIWSNVLGIDNIGINDNFFELGGHSLRAAQVAARIRNEFRVEIPLAVIFSSNTIAELARVVSTRLAAPDHAPVMRAIPVAARDSTIPLSFSQERVWFLQQLDPTSLAYNFQTLLCFDGPLDVPVLQACLSELIARHEVLRTSFEEVHGVAQQRIAAPFAIDLPLVDLRAVPASEREDVMRARISEETARPFDMSALPLIRWVVYQLEEQRFAVLHIEHHLIHDGWSFNVFRRELLELYVARLARKPSPLKPPAIQFADFTVWQRQWLQGDVLQAQLDFWKQQLADAPVLELPTDRARPPAQTFQGAVHEFVVRGDVYTALRRLSEKSDATLFVTLQAAFAVLLHRYSGQDDISIGTGIANRRWSETEDMLGMLVNNVVLRSRLRGNPAFSKFVRDTRDTAFDAFANQDAPFDQIVRAVEHQADSSRNPLFQVMFSFHDSPLDEPEIPGVNFSCVELISNRSAKFDLNVVVVPHAEQRSGQNVSGGPDGITFLWEYNSALFDAATVEQMSRHYETLLNAVVANPNATVYDLPMLSATETDALVYGCNQTTAAYPHDGTIARQFEAQVARTPDATALVYLDRVVTYGELNARANMLAHDLSSDGVTRGSNVGICVERSVELMVSLLAVLKLGAAYVPLDPGYPSERLAFIAQETGTRLVLTDASTTPKCAEWSHRVFPVTTYGSGAVDVTGATASSDATAEDIAYVMYTSGSTGRPKGVEIPNRGVLRLIFGSTFAGLGAHERILQMAPLSFDSSTFEIWGALLHGGTCVLHAGTVPAPRQLGDVLNANAVSTLWLTSSMFNVIMDEAPDVLAGVRQLLVGGEALSVPHIRRAQKVLPNTRITNGYGPTESTTFACCYAIDEPVSESARSIPIGRPIANTKVYLLDQTRRPVPFGVTGELYIAGDGLARGYVAQPELTAERFVHDPFGVDGARMYRTGDHARRRRDGVIEFIGRVDDQVKIRGYRIELGEIESVLREQTGIRDAAVVVRHDTPAGATLVAYVVTESGLTLDTAILLAALRKILPSHMVPARVVTLDALPLAPTGKVSRQLLPAPDASASDTTRTIVAPSTDTESAIAAMWCNTLQLAEVSVDDSFFDLGGHSLLATRIIAQIRDELLVELPLRTLFEFPTVAGLARAVDGGLSSHFSQLRAGSNCKYLFPLRPNANEQPVFFLPGGLGGDYEFLVYARLVHFVGDGFAFFGLRARSADGIESAHETTEQMASDYIAELRSVQPNGPYRIVGNCIGGIIAYEMARQLSDAGEPVESLVLMDCTFPRRKEYVMRSLTHALSRVAPNLNASYYRQRLSHHLSAMRGLSLARKVQYATGKIRLGASAVTDLGGAPTAERLVQIGYEQTLRRYRPKPYAGSVDLIASQDDADFVSGWADVVRGELAVHTARGDHETYIREFVEQVARQVRDCLKR